MKRYTLLIVLLAISLSAGLFAQNASSNKITVTGIVTDENNEPIIGANVVIANTTSGLGTITDLDGKYTIKMEPYNRLIFSFIGYEKQEVLVKEQRVVNVVLKEDKSTLIDEVVVTGTGAQKKLTLTGSVTTVDMEQLKATPGGNITNSLAGNVAGVIARQTSGQPGKNVSEFWIRGISTFGASSSALVLVDGFERDMSQLNIEDIETFTVLKDASETAIYGSRGANGVVLITTKRGKEGKINIDGKFETTYNTRTFTPDFVDGYTYARMMNEARVTRNQEAIYGEDELEILRLGLDPDMLPDVDWMDLLLKDGAMTYRGTLNLNGGGKNVRYFISGSYLNEQGMFNTDESLKDYNTNSNHEKWNYRMNADVDITPTTLLQVGIGGTYRKMNQTGASSGELWYSLMGQNPVSIPVMYSNGYVPAYGTGNRTNPWVLSTQFGYMEQWWNEIQTNVTLTQDLKFITKGLKFIGRFGFDTNNYNQINRKKWPDQWRAERFRDNNGEIVFKRIAWRNEMTQTAYGEGDRKDYLEAELHYQRGFNEHNIGGVLKYSQDSKTQTQNIGGDVKNALARKHQGLAGSVSYNWQYRYFVNFNFGYTGSENFATGHQWGYFPAYSVAWNVAEEPFIRKHAAWMEMMKFRYSYGKVGNDNLTDAWGNTIRFPYLYTIGSGYSESDAWRNNYNWGDYNFSNSYNGLRFTSPGSVGVTWEIATKHDIGLDLSLFKDKFTMTLDWFREQRDGIFMARNYLPLTVGLENTSYANVGSVRSTGWDGNFAFRQSIGKVNITIRGNMTYSKNEVLEKDEAYNVYPYQMEKGYRVNQAKGLIALGLFKDYDDIRNSAKQEFGTVQPGDIKYKDVNGDGVVNDGDRVAIGATTVPNLIYGAGISAQWKGLDVNVLFQGTGKSSFFINGASVYPFSNGDWGNILTDVAESSRWISRDISGDPSTEDPHAKYPRLSYGGNSNNYRASTYWLRNGSYVRLKTLELGYTLPKVWVNKFRVNDLRIFFIGTNLLTFSKFKLWDPELGSSTGMEYPLTKSLTLGLNIKL